MLLRHVSIACLAGAFTVSTLAETPPPAKIETLFQHAHYGLTKLSPDGKYIATAAQLGDRVQLVTINLDTKEAKVAAGGGDADVAWFTWINDHRLVFDIQDQKIGLADQTGGGIYAVDADGRSFHAVVPTYREQLKLDAQLRPEVTDGRYLGHFSGSNDILLGEWNVDQFRAEKGFRPVRFNTLTGRRTPVSIGISGRITNMQTDWRGEPRTAESVDDNGLETLWYRAPGQDKWAAITEPMRMYSSAHIHAAGFAPDGKLTMVEKSQDGDKSAIYAYDADKHALGTLVFEDKDADIGDLVFDKKDGHLLGVETYSDAPKTRWVDADWAKLQKDIDAALPNTANDLQGDPHGRVLIHAFSDQDPGRYYLYETQTHKLIEQLVVRPDIDPTKMAATQIMHYKARDGMPIMAYLTFPPGRDPKSLPLIVLPHGGPYARDQWGFNPEVQFLATRGYAVLQPQFRGSTGFGSRLFVGGWKTWGLAMQDDLTSGVNGLVKAGVVDAKRVCIMGASYGGYAVLMGLAKDPDLYRCGIDFAGVSDITLMYTTKWSDFTSSLWADFGMKQLIGDPDELKDQFAATSPIQQAGKIKAPVMLVYSSDDYRVPIVHGKQMRQALEDNKKVYEWHEIADEAHGLMKESNRFTFYHQVEDFLKRYNPSDMFAEK